MATKIKNKTFHTSIDLEEGVRTQIIDLLNQQLADTFDLFSLTKQAHWNVKGPEFMQLHEFYDTLAEGLEDYVDTIAERITALGGFAKGTVRMAAAATRLPDFTGEPVSGLEQVKAVIKLYAQLAASTRTGIDAADEAGDADTADLLTGISRDLDKWLWFLEAHVQD